MNFEGFQPNLAIAREESHQMIAASARPTLIPLSISIIPDLITPVDVFLELSFEYGIDY